MADPLLAYSFRKGVFFLCLGGWCTVCFLSRESMRFLILILFCLGVWSFWLLDNLLKVKEILFLFKFFMVLRGVFHPSLLFSFGIFLSLTVSKRGNFFFHSSPSFPFILFDLFHSDCCSDAVLWISRTITFLSPLFFLLIDIILSTKEICIAFQLFPQVFFSFHFLFFIFYFFIFVNYFP